MASPDSAGAPARPSSDAGERARRASSFGAAASAYAQHRPDYPGTGIGWLLEPVTKTAASHPLRILDLGAGTGKLTASLAGLRFEGEPADVTAVEPDPKMLAELRDHVPGVTALSGRAESIPLPDASVDAVLAGQAAHWFDLDLAMPEIARVLRPGGVFGGLWNADDDRVEWVAGLHKASGRPSVVQLSIAKSHDDDAIVAWLAGAGHALFTPLEEAIFEHSQARTADSLIQTMRTHSMFLVMEPPEREAVLTKVRAYLDHTPQTASGEFSLPLVTLAIRIVRR